MLEEVDVKKRKYTVEFKQQAVELAKALGSIKKAADQLGVPDANIHKWSKRFSEASPSSGETRPEESSADELKRLRQENAEQKKVIHILKSAAAFFSQDHLK